MSPMLLASAVLDKVTVLSTSQTATAERHLMTLSYSSRPKPLAMPGCRVRARRPGGVEGGYAEPPHRIMLPSQLSIIGVLVACGIGFMVQPILLKRLGMWASKRNPAASVFVAQSWPIAVVAAIGAGLLCFALALLLLVRIYA